MTCTEKYVSVKNDFKSFKLFKEGRNDFQDKDRLRRPIIASTPEMVDFVNALILAHIKVTISKHF